MKKWVKFFLILAIIFTCSGCNRSFSQSSVASSMVSSITVTCESCDSFTRRDYSSPEKLRLILLCIRQLGPDFPAKTDVDALAGKTLHISLTCTDGNRITYRIKNNQYLRKNGGPWRQINGNSASGFYQLLLMLPEDGSSRLTQDPFQTLPGRRVYFPAIGLIRGQKKS